MDADPRPDPHRDLEIALFACAETNRVIAAADVKAGLVLAAQGVVLAGLVSGLGRGPLPPLARAGVLVVLVLAGCAVLLLLGALWPRLRSEVPSWLAFPGLRAVNGDILPDRPPYAVLAEQAWRQAGALAAIARSKYRWFRAAVATGAADVLLFATWLAIAAP